MAFTVYDGILAYARRANSALYLSCRTSIFNNPDNQVYTPKGKKTAIRQYESGKAGTYDKNKGYMQTYGSGKGIEWIEYEAPFDRAKVLTVDAIDELQSYANGMTPSIELLNSDFFNNQMPAEIDAANIAQFFSKIPDFNIKESSVYDTSVDGILDTVLALENDIFNSGYDGKSVLFMRSAVYKNFQKAIIANHGLASGTLMKRTLSVSIDTELGKLLAGADDKISVNVELNEFDNFYVIQMPDDRMYNLITMLDGTSVGQTDGGYVADDSDPNFALIDLLAIPFVAAFTNVRHLVDNFLVPASMPTTGFTQVDLEKLNNRMFGNVEIGFAGINQKANAFEYDIRVIYGGDLFDNRRRNCFAVIHSNGSEPTPGPTPSYDTLTINCDSSVVAGVDATVTLTADDSTPVDVEDAAFTVVPGTGTGYVSVSKGVATFSGTSAGTVTIVATAGGALGTKEVTVTSE
jgi:hypothetical protein